MPNGRSHSASHHDRRDDRGRGDTRSEGKQIWLCGARKVISNEEIEKYLKRIDNLSLLLTKYVPLIKENDKPYAYSTAFKKNHLKTAIRSLPFSKEHDIVLEGFIPILKEKYKTGLRLVCGLGAGSVLETSITIHHTRGVPYIPGSSFKGVCRQAAFWRCIEKKGISQNDAKNFHDTFYGELSLSDPDVLFYQILFGAQDFKGLLLFLDAYPEITDNNVLALDIMNPHYSGYYDGAKKSPGDWESPVPIPFLTVRHGVVFMFSVLFDQWRWRQILEHGIEVKRGKEKYTLYFTHSSDKEEDKSKNGKYFPEVAQKIEQIQTDTTPIKGIVKEALNYYGVGSKTRLGYGSFNVPD